MPEIKSSLLLPGQPVSPLPTLPPPTEHSYGFEQSGKLIRLCRARQARGGDSVFPRVQQWGLLEECQGDPGGSWWGVLRVQELGEGVKEQAAGTWESSSRATEDRQGRPRGAEASWTLSGL